MTENNSTIPEASMMNETFVVASIGDCATILTSDERSNDYLWRETEVGCKVLMLLQEIHKFNITYIEGPQKTIDYFERKGAIYEFSEQVDIYVKPRTLWQYTLYNGTPIMPIFSWSFGFTLRRPNPNIQHFFSLPFSASVWHSLIAMVLLAAVLFYILNHAEQWLLGTGLDCFFSQELLIAIGACCQHYLPINPMELTSRRIAFSSFFLFSFLIYSYYTSTLLSDLVHDKDNDMDLKTLGDSTYEPVVLDSVDVVIRLLLEVLHRKDNAMSPPLNNFIKKKLTNFRVVNISTGLAEVETCSSALLSEYTSLYPAMKETYNNNVICELIKVNVFSNVLKYLFTSKTFKYIEEFKMSILRASETGVLQRLLANDDVPSIFGSYCVSSHFQAQIQHVKLPLIILTFSYVLCVLILLGERAYYKRHKVWPYVE